MFEGDINAAAAKIEAVMQEASDQVPPMSVLQTFQAGYRMGDRVLRPAKVKVSKAP